jgi:hypothetical protein
VNVMGIAVGLTLHRQLHWPAAPALILGIAITLGAAAYLLSAAEKHEHPRVGEEEETPVNA